MSEPDFFYLSWRDGVPTNLIASKMLINKKNTFRVYPWNISELLNVADKLAAMAAAYPCLYFDSEETNEQHKEKCDKCQSVWLYEQWLESQK